MVSQPCELYCQFGLDLKRRSPAPATAVIHGGGYNGYLPTSYGPLGGGYSADPMHWSRQKPETGYRIVDAGARMLHELWE